MQNIQVLGGGTVSFPDGMSQDEITEVLKNNPPPTLTPEQQFGSISQDNTPSWKRTVGDVLQKGTEFGAETAKWLGGGVAAAVGQPEVSPLVGGLAQNTFRSVADATTSPIRSLLGIPYEYNPALGEQAPPQTFGEGAVRSVKDILSGAQDVAVAEIIPAASSKAFQGVKSTMQGSNTGGLSARALEQQLGQEEWVATMKAMGFKDNPIESVAPTALKGDIVKPPSIASETPLETPKLPEGMKERGFITHAKSEETALTPELKAKAEGAYATQTDQSVIEGAKARVKANPEAVFDNVMGKKLLTNQDEIADALALVEHYDSIGQLDRASNLINDVLAKSATETARALRAYAFLSKRTPDGAVNFAEKIIKEAQLKNPNIPNLTPEQRAIIKAKAKEVYNMSEGYEKQYAMAELAQLQAKNVPASFLKKTSTAQTLAMLLSPTTIARNILGNTGMQVMEFATDPIRAMVDKGVGFLYKAAGKENIRTATISGYKDQLKKYWNGFITGGRQGFKEAWNQVDTKGLGTQYEYSNQRVFTNKYMNYLERTLGVALRAPDRAAFQAAYDKKISEFIRLNEINGVPQPSLITSEMAEKAADYGRYVTFQDDNVLANSLSAFKKGLNKLTGSSEFGTGDLVLKFTKTLANISQRGLAYSPLGVFKSLYEVGKPLLTKSGFNRAAFVDSTARAIVGSAGLTETGYLLQKLGLLTPIETKDKNVSGLYSESGIKKYQLNVSGLYRTIKGLDLDGAQMIPGDTLVSYDWVLPAAIPFEMGIRLSESRKKSAYKKLLGESDGAFDTITNIGEGVMGAIASGLQPVINQPFLTGVSRLVSNTSEPLKAVEDMFAAAPATFIPSLVKKASALTDEGNLQRQKGNSFGEMLKYNTFQGIPLLNETLPKKAGLFGEDVKRYQSNDPLTVFLSPAIVTKYLPNQEAQEVIRLYKDNGWTEQLPKVAPKELTIGGLKFDMSPEEMTWAQKEMGTKAKEIISRMINMPGYQMMTDENRARIIASQLNRANEDVKSDLFYSKVIKFKDIRRLLKNIATEKLSDREMKDRNKYQLFQKLSAKAAQYQNFGLIEQINAARDLIND